MDRMTCIWEESGPGPFSYLTRVLMDNATGVQYLVVSSGSATGGASVTPLLNKDGGILVVQPYNGQ